MSWRPNDLVDGSKGLKPELSLDQSSIELLSLYIYIYILYKDQDPSKDIKGTCPSVSLRHVHSDLLPSNTTKDQAG